MKYFTYILSDTTAIKIGKTKGLLALKNRVKKLQCGNPRKIRIIGGFHIDIETELHRKYSGFRLWSEWFENIIILKIFEEVGFLYKGDFLELLRAETETNL